MSLDAILADARIVITLGPGGVGKTTTSAALALRAARAGRRALVCTIDPARRLAWRSGSGAWATTRRRSRRSGSWPRACRPRTGCRR